MYRPLVLPKFHTSRGQPISPGVTLLTSGGPKHRGQLVVPNPNLLRNAEGWTQGADPCAGVNYLDGRVEALNLNDSGFCDILVATNPRGPVQIGERYQAITYIRDVQGTSTFYAFVGGGTASFDANKGFQVAYIDIESVGTDKLALSAFLSTNFSVVIEYFGISYVGDF